MNPLPFLKIIMKIKMLFLSLLLATPAAFAAPISVSNQQAINTSGQFFNFSFAGLPTTGTGGQFNITLNGDYTAVRSKESALVTLDVAGGGLDLGSENDGNEFVLNGINSNTIAGITLNSFTSTIFVAARDAEHTWVFNISDLLLNALLADGSLTATVQNGVGANSFGAFDPDFVRVGFTFDSDAAVPGQVPSGTSVPEPATLTLFGLGVVALTSARRRARA